MGFSHRTNEVRGYHGIWAMVNIQKNMENHNFIAG